MLKILKEKNIIHKDQGYALYFYYNGKEYSAQNQIKVCLSDESLESVEKFIE